MGRFTSHDTAIAGVKIVERQRLGDERGYLSRLFCAEELAPFGWTAPIAQINHTFTGLRGTVRGMHFQRAPHAEMKLVSCIRGAVMDIAVDLRAGSPTFLQSCSVELSAENGRALLIPEGCAHGFQALTDDVELVYLHSAPYARGAEGGVSPLDPRLGLDWPLPITVISDRDRNHPAVSHDFEGLS